MNTFPGLDNYVYLDEASHRYFDRDGREYMSVSKFRERFKTPFNRDAAAAREASFTGKRKSEVLQGWDDYTTERSDDGTNWHNALELFEKTTQIEPHNERLRPALLSITSEYRHYHKVHQEQIVYCTEAMVAGTIDKPCETTSHKNSIVDLSDYKTNIKGVLQKDLDKHGKPKNKYFLHCLSHMMESKYNDYALQLSIYAYMLQKQTNRKIGATYIHYVPPLDPLNHFKIPTPYMKNEVEAMFAWHMANPVVTLIQEKSPLQPNWSEF